LFDVTKATAERRKKEKSEKEILQKKRHEDQMALKNPQNR
jgi:hypothetical protein